MKNLITFFALTLAISGCHKEKTVYFNQSVEAQLPTLTAGQCLIYFNDGDTSQGDADKRNQNYKSDLASGIYGSFSGVIDSNTIRRVDVVVPTYYHTWVRYSCDQTTLIRDAGPYDSSMISYFTDRVPSKVNSLTRIKLDVRTLPGDNNYLVAYFR